MRHAEESLKPAFQICHYWRSRYAIKEVKMRDFKHVLKILTLPVILLAFPAILMPQNVRAEGENLIHSDRYDIFHVWDDGLSEWQNGRPSFYDLKTEADENGFISDEKSAVIFDLIRLEEAGLRAGQKLTLEGTFSFFPIVDEDWVYLNLVFYDENNAELATYISEMVTSTRESGPVYRAISEVIPDNTDYLVCAFILNKKGEEDHLYFRDIKLTIAENGSRETAETSETAKTQETTETAEYTDSSETSDPAGMNNSSAAGGSLDKDDVDVVGDAFLNTQGYYVLTKEEQNQAGTVWIRNPQEINDFSISFDYYTGSGKISGADGITLVFYADRTTVRDDRSYLSVPGSVGYGVEIDTYYNEALEDLKDNHFAILDGYMGNHLNYADATSYSEDGQFHHMKVVVENGTCFVYVDGLLRLGKSDIVPTGSYDIGITARTGGLFNVQVVKDIVVTWKGTNENISAGTKEDAASGEKADTDPENVLPTSTPIPTVTPMAEEVLPYEPAETDQTVPGDDGSQTKEILRSPSGFSTTEAATLADTQWISYDILMGKAPSGVEKLVDFSEVTGGWKGYIIVDPEGKYDSVMEMLLNVQINGTESDASLTFDWSYIYMDTMGEGYEDSTPDSVFSGIWSEGGITAEGPGSLHLTDFYYAAGHEYAIGTLTSRDGVPASIMLVRP